MEILQARRLELPCPPPGNLPNPQGDIEKYKPKLDWQSSETNRLTAVSSTAATMETRASIRNSPLEEIEGGKLLSAPLWLADTDEILPGPGKIGKPRLLGFEGRDLMFLIQCDPDTLILALRLIGSKETPVKPVIEKYTLLFIKES